jgi:hypothetical protein
MSYMPMTPDEEYEFYSRPENQVPQGPGRRRGPSRLGTPVPVRFPPELLEEARRAADADDRSLSAWIRRAVDHELRRSASGACSRPAGWRAGLAGCLAGPEGTGRRAG